jgi:6-phosphogluconolactonase
MGCSFWMKLFFALLLFWVPAVRGGTVVYVSESGHNRVAVYSLDEAAGALKRRDDVLLEGAPGALCLSADKRHLYAAVRSEKKFTTLAIDPVAGLLTVVSTVPAAGQAAFLSTDRTGRWLLAAYYSEGLVSVSRIDEAGVIEDEPLWILDIGPKAHCLVTDPSNRFAFCPHPMDLNCVDQFLFDETSGQLTLNTPPTLAGEKVRDRGICAFIPMENGSIS